MMILVANAAAEILSDEPRWQIDVQHRAIGSETRKTRYQKIEATRSANESRSEANVSKVCDSSSIPDVIDMTLTQNDPRWCS